MKLTLDSRLPVVIVGAQASKFNKQTEHDAKIVIRNILLGTHKTVPQEMYMLATYNKLQLITGACHKGGIDIWAQQEAERSHIPVRLFKPQVRQWPDIRVLNENKDSKTIQFKEYGNIVLPLKLGVNIFKGYKSRNDQMATCGSIGFDIEPAGSCRHCGGKGTFDNEDLEDRICNKCEGTGAYSGGRYTINKMISLGKEGHIIAIS